jgi:hypothetical protein
MKKTMILLLATLLVTAGLVSAQDEERPARYKGREHIKIDHEAMKSMSREEKRAYMQAYKKARAEEAEQAGIVPPKTGQFQRLETPRKVEAPRAVPYKQLGNITYDTGTASGTAGIASQMLGNRFDTALNPPGTMCCFPVETTGSVTMITFDMVNTFFSSAVWSLYSNVMGTTAMRITSMGTGVMTGLNTLSVMSPTTANAYSNGPFLAGIFQFMPASTGLAVDTGTIGTQGFHAVSINDGTTGSMLTTVNTGGGGGLNAIFRVTGDAPTPVELMDFKIEED